MIDPFADDFNTAPTAAVAPTTAPEVKPVTPPTNDGKLTVTLKGGTGFDSPWIVIHAYDAIDALTQLEDKNLKDLITRTKAVAAFFAGGTAAPQQPAQAAQPTRPAGQPAGAAQAPNGDSRQCQHGEMVFRSGVGRTGKTWSAFMCPTPKGTPDQCPAEFLR